MAQYTCTKLKKRQILAAMFLTIFIGLLGVGVIISIARSITLVGQAILPIAAGITTSININLPIAAGATATLLAWAMFMILRARNKACASVTASP